MDNWKFAPHLAHLPGIRQRFIQLRARLRNIVEDREVFYVPNPGNYGDGLIRWATLQFLQDAGFRYCEYSNAYTAKWEHAASNAVLIFGGGGGWSQLWPHSVDIVRDCAPLFHRVVVLPSTYELDEAVPGVSYFARDRFESLEHRPDAIFCDDMAFYLKNAPLTRGDAEGFFFRLDSESASAVVPPQSNQDVSSLGSYQSHPKLLIDSLSHYAIIHTDRLHVGILGALLGKHVHLHSSSYFKTQAVYESSIRGAFPGVIFYDHCDSR